MSTNLQKETICEECQGVNGHRNPYCSRLDLSSALAEDEKQSAEDSWTGHGMATGDYDTCQRCGKRYGTFQANCPNVRDHAPRHAATVERLVELLKQIAVAYSDDPGTSDLDDEQPVSVSLNLGHVRLARRLI